MSDLYDTSEYRRRLWDFEYSEGKRFGATLSSKPSGALTRFLHDYDTESKSAIDLGCGNGRNSILLAKEGFIVTAIDFSQVALDLVSEHARELNLQKQIRILNHDFSHRLELPTASAGLILDIFTTQALSTASRQLLYPRIEQLLKPDGYFLMYTLATDCPAAQKLIATMPGPESGSYRFTAEGQVFTDKTFTENELETLFPSLTLLELEAQHKKILSKEGEEWDYTFLYAVYQK